MELAIPSITLSQHQMDLTEYYNSITANPEGFEWRVLVQAQADYV